MPQLDFFILYDLLLITYLITFFLYINIVLFILPYILLSFFFDS
jgi:hypothetical protein